MSLGGGRDCVAILLSPRWRSVHCGSNRWGLVRGGRRCGHFEGIVVVFMPEFVVGRLEYSSAEVVGWECAGMGPRQARKVGELQVP